MASDMHTERPLLLQARHSLRHALEWQRIEVPHDLGIDCGNYKWRQNQSCVEVFVRMPENVASSKVHPSSSPSLPQNRACSRRRILNQQTLNLHLRQVRVEMTPCVLHITVDGDHLVGGRLWAEIKQEDSTWQISGGILEFSLLKRSRRNNYANGHTNADTFWRHASHYACCLTVNVDALRNVAGLCRAQVRLEGHATA